MASDRAPYMAGQDETPARDCASCRECLDGRFEANRKVTGCPRDIENAVMPILKIEWSTSSPQTETDLLQPPLRPRPC